MFVYPPFQVPSYNFIAPASCWLARLDLLLRQLFLLLLFSPFFRFPSVHFVSDFIAPAFILTFLPDFDLLLLTTPHSCFSYSCKSLFILLSFFQVPFCTIVSAYYLTFCLSMTSYFDYTAVKRERERERERDELAWWCEIFEQPRCPPRGCACLNLWRARLWDFLTRGPGVPEHTSVSF